jgi:hypothetical protein
MLRPCVSFPRSGWSLARSLPPEPPYSAELNSTVSATAATVRNMKYNSESK